MEKETDRQDVHLTETEFHQLLGEQADAGVVDRARRHLEECESCQTMLETLASKPEQWIRFASLMKQQAGTRSVLPEQLSHAENSTTSAIPSVDSSEKLTAVALAGLIGAMLLGTLLSGLLLYSLWGIRWRHKNPSSTPPSSPPAPAAPSDVPVAPRPDHRVANDH